MVTAKAYCIAGRTDYDEELKLNATSALRFYKRLRSLKEGNELLHFKIGLGNAGLGYYYKGHRGEADMDMNTVAYECTVLDGNGQRKRGRRRLVRDCSNTSEALLRERRC